MNEILINRYLDHLDLEQMHQEGISSIARKSGEHTGKKLKPFRFFAGKAAKGAATAVGKTATSATKVAAKGIWGAAKGVGSIAKGIVKAPGKVHKAAMTTPSKIPSPIDVARSYYRKKQSRKTRS